MRLSTFRDKCKALRDPPGNHPRANEANDADALLGSVTTIIGQTITATMAYDLCRTPAHRLSTFQHADGQGLWDDSAAIDCGQTPEPRGCRDRSFTITQIQVTSDVPDPASALLLFPALAALARSRQKPGPTCASSPSRSITPGCPSIST